MRQTFGLIRKASALAVGAMLLALGMLATVPALPLPALAQVPPQRQAGTALSVPELERAWPSLTPKQQFAAIEQLLHGAHYDVAGRLLERATYPHRGDAAIKRFFQGMVARGQGRNQDAVAIFREVLASHPEFTRVRLELAQTLFAINEDESARHNFELVLGSTGSSPGLETTVRSYINAIEGRRRWDMTAFLTIAPSTNLNQGASTQTVILNGLPFQLSDRNVGKSGIGLYGGVQAGYRQPLMDRLDLVMTGGVQAKRYKEDDFNDTLVNASVGPKWRFDRGFLGLYGTADYRWLTDHAYAGSVGGLVSGGYSLTPTDIAFADTGCSLKRYDRDWLGTDLTYQNGSICFLSGRLEHFFDSRTFVRAIGNLAVEDADRDHLDSRSKGLGAGIYREIPWGISVYLQGLYTDIDFNGDYPGFGVARRDSRLDGTVSLTKRDFVMFGLAPMLQYTYTHNDSNIPFHVYDAHGTALTLTKRF